MGSSHQGKYILLTKASASFSPRQVRALTQDWRWCRGVQFCEYPKARGLVFKVIDLVIFHVDLIFAGGKVVTVAVFE